jgi:hypothetical protein
MGMTHREPVSVVGLGGRPVKVLLLPTEARGLPHLADTFVRLGYRVMVAWSRRDARRLASCEPPDVVIVDGCGAAKSLAELSGVLSEQGHLSPEMVVRKPAASHQQTVRAVQRALSSRTLGAQIW